MRSMEKLGESVAKMGSVAVCFSGGYDSTALLSLATRKLPDSHVAVFVDMPMLPREQVENAERIAESLNARLVKVKLEWEDLPDVYTNSSNRCYCCKHAVYSAVMDFANDLGIKHVIAGENVDDLDSNRPGRTAGTELGVQYPMLEFDIGRKDVEEYVGTLGLDFVFENTCLATRFPTYTELDDDLLRLAELCEKDLLEVTRVKSLRLRMHGNGVVLEAYGEEMHLFDACRDNILPVLGKYGIKSVSYGERRKF